MTAPKVGSSLVSEAPRPRDFLGNKQQRQLVQGGWEPNITKPGDSDGAPEDTI